MELQDYNPSLEGKRYERPTGTRIRPGLTVGFDRKRDQEDSSSTTSDKRPVTALDVDETARESSYSIGSLLDNLNLSWYIQPF